MFFEAILGLIESRLANLPSQLQEHVFRARSVGRDLSPLTSADPIAVDIALAAHDVFRSESPLDLLRESVRFGLQPDQFELAEPMLLHGPLAAAWLGGESVFNNESILAAVRYHTTLSPHMDVNGLTVFIADKIDPTKVKEWPELAEVRRVAYSGELKMAVEIYLRLRLTSLSSENRTIHPRSVNALNWLVGLRQCPA